MNCSTQIYYQVPSILSNRWVGIAKQLTWATYQLRLSATNRRIAVALGKFI